MQYNFGSTSRTVMSDRKIQTTRRLATKKSKLPRVIKKEQKNHFFRTPNCSKRKTVISQYFREGPIEEMCYRVHPRVQTRILRARRNRVGGRVWKVLNTKKSRLSTSLVQNACKKIRAAHPVDLRLHRWGCPLQLKSISTGIGLLGFESDSELGHDADNPNHCDENRPVYKIISVFKNGHPWRSCCCATRQHSSRPDTFSVRSLAFSI